MEHLKILNTNMMMDICTNELQIALKEQRVEEGSIKDKLKGIQEQIEKQKQLLINNFQNINTFFY